MCSNRIRAEARRHENLWTAGPTHVILELQAEMYIILELQAEMYIRSYLKKRDLKKRDVCHT